jgi:hypothetical protein
VKEGEMMDTFKIRTAMEAALFEFTTLAPRLSEPYRKNAKALIVRLAEALEELERAETEGDAP